MNRTREQWARIDAKFCAIQNSATANWHLIQDAQKDIAELHRERDALLAERDALKKDADKFRHVERAMEALGCDEREGGIVTAASLVLISSAHRMNAKRGVIDQEGVTFDDGQIGDWRVTIERIDAALQGAQP